MCLACNFFKLNNDDINVINKMQFISIFLRFPPEDTFIDFFRERGSGGEEREKERGRETST